MVPTKQLCVLSTYVKTYITVFRIFFFFFGGGGGVGGDRIMEVFRISSITCHYWEKQRERLEKTSNM